MNKKIITEHPAIIAYQQFWKSIMTAFDQKAQALLTGLSARVASGDITIEDYNKVEALLGKVTNISIETTDSKATTFFEALHAYLRMLHPTGQDNFTITNVQVATAFGSLSSLHGYGSDIVNKSVAMLFHPDFASFFAEQINAYPLGASDAPINVILANINNLINQIGGHILNVNQQIEKIEEMFDFLKLTQERNNGPLTIENLMYMFIGYLKGAGNSDKAGYYSKGIFKLAKHPNAADTNAAFVLIWDMMQAIDNNIELLKILAAFHDIGQFGLNEKAHQDQDGAVKSGSHPDAAREMFMKFQDQYPKSNIILFDRLSTKTQQMLKNNPANLDALIRSVVKTHIACTGAMAGKGENHLLFALIAVGLKEAQPLVMDPELAELYANILGLVACQDISGAGTKGSPGFIDPKIVRAYKETVEIMITAMKRVREGSLTIAMDENNGVPAFGSLDSDAILQSVYPDMSLAEIHNHLLALSFDVLAFNTPIGDPARGDKQVWKYVNQKIIRFYDREEEKLVKKELSDLFNYTLEIQFFRAFVQFTLIDGATNELAKRKDLRAKGIHKKTCFVGTIKSEDNISAKGLHFWYLLAKKINAMRADLIKEGKISEKGMITLMPTGSINMQGYLEYWRSTADGSVKKLVHADDRLAIFVREVLQSDEDMQAFLDNYLSVVPAPGFGTFQILIKVQEFLRDNNFV